MYKNEFRHHACFLLLVLSVKNSNCVCIRTNFGTTLLFRYLFCQLNCNTYHIPNTQLEIQIIAEYTQLRHVGTAANYKVLHNKYISSTALK